MTVTLWSTTARDGRQLPTLGTVARALIRSARHLPADPLPSAWKGGNYPIYSYLPLSTPSDLRFYLKPGKCRSMPFHVSLGMPRTLARTGHSSISPTHEAHSVGGGGFSAGGETLAHEPDPKISKPIRQYRPDLLHDSRRCYGCNAIVRVGARDECEGPRPSAPTAPSSLVWMRLSQGMAKLHQHGRNPRGHGVRGRENEAPESRMPPRNGIALGVPIWFHDCPHMGLERLR